MDYESHHDSSNSSPLLTTSTPCFLATRNSRLAGAYSTMKPLSLLCHSESRKKCRLTPCVSDVTFVMSRLHTQRSVSRKRIRLPVTQTICRTLCAWLSKPGIGIG